MPKYKCIGCGEIHNDNDYSKEDGDILIGKREEELNSKREEVTEEEHEERLKKLKEIGLLK